MWRQFNGEDGMGMDDQRMKTPWLACSLLSFLVAFGCEADVSAECPELSSFTECRARSECLYGDGPEGETCYENCEEEGGECPTGRTCELATLGGNGQNPGSLAYWMCLEQ